MKKVILSRAQADAIEQIIGEAIDDGCSGPEQHFKTVLQLKCPAITSAAINGIMYHASGIAENTYVLLQDHGSTPTRDDIQSVADDYARLDKFLAKHFTVRPVKGESKRPWKWHVG